MYETRAVLQTVDQHALPIMALCMLALVGNYIYWIENLRLGFRHKIYSMPVGCLLFFLPHDATFVALYWHWFHDINHWFPKLWWAGLCVTVCMELVFLTMLLKYGRKELAPRASQSLFSGIILLGLILCSIAWLVVKSTMDDELFLVIFGVTLFWCAPFNFGLMALRQSAVGQSQLAWLGFLMMPIFYYPATMMLSPGFHSPLWIAFGVATVVGGLVNLAYIRSLQHLRIPAAAAQLLQSR
jgi:hypothetical protein